jgi:hypothetical protein
MYIHRLLQGFVQRGSKAVFYLLEILLVACIALGYPYDQ